MSVRVVTVLAGAAVGGAETFFVSLTTALSRAGADVRSVIKNNPVRETQLAAAGIVHRLAPFRQFFDVTTGPVLRQVIADHRPDVMLAFAGRAASRVPRGNYALIGRLGGYYNLKNFRTCDTLICNTPDLVRYVVEGGWPKARVFHIANFPSLPDGEAIGRDMFDTPEGVPLALALGRLHPVKGLDVLIRAMARVPGLHVWIAGEGPERAALERLAREMGVFDRIRFLGWRTDRTALFKAADLCVYPSREEPFGNVIVEAWATGTPIVAAASVGPSWLARNGEDAILVPVGDSEALADGIKAVLSSKDLAMALTAAGRRRVQEEFSETAIVKRYLDLFDQVRPRCAE